MTDTAPVNLDWKNYIPEDYLKYLNPNEDEDRWHYFTQGGDPFDPEGDQDWKPYIPEQWRKYFGHPKIYVHFM